MWRHWSKNIASQRHLSRLPACFTVVNKELSIHDNKRGSSTRTCVSAANSLDGPVLLHLYNVHFICVCWVAGVLSADTVVTHRRGWASVIPFHCTLSSVDLNLFPGVDERNSSLTDRQPAGACIPIQGKEPGRLGGSRSHRRPVFFIHCTSPPFTCNLSPT